MTLAIYRCARCGKTFTKMKFDEWVTVDMRRRLPVEHPFSAPVCDPCWDQVKGQVNWNEEEGEEGKPLVPREVGWPPPSHRDI